MGTLHRPPPGSAHSLVLAAVPHDDPGVDLLSLRRPEQDPAHLVIFLDQRLPLVAFAFATLSAYPLFLSRPRLHRAAVEPASAAVASAPRP